MNQTESKQIKVDEEPLSSKPLQSKTHEEYKAFNTQHPCRALLQLSRLLQSDTRKVFSDCQRYNRWWFVSGARRGYFGKAT